MHTEEATIETTSRQSKLTFSQNRNQHGELMEADGLSDHNKENQIEKTTISLSNDEKTHRLILELENANLKSIQNPFVNNHLANILENYDSTSFGLHKNRCKPKNAAKFENLPIVQFKNYLSLVDESTNKYIPKKVFVRRMSNLVRWILLIHKSARINILPNSSHAEEEDLSNKLIVWIVSETFTPKSSLPVTGIIRQINYSMDKRAFGVVQLMLIDFLSKNINSREMAILTGFSCILIWYEKMNIQIPHLLKGSDEEKTRFLIESSMFNTQKVKENLQNQNQSLVPIKYKNFQLPKEMNIPDHIIPNRDFDSIQGFKTYDKLEMVKKIEGFYQVKVIHTGRGCHFKDVPVYLVAGSDDRDKDSRSIKISCIKGETIELKAITRCSNSIIAYLILSHCALVEAISKEDGSKMSVFLIESQSHFIDWIKKEFFAPEGSLPLFGKVGKVEKPYDRSKFGDNQLAFINYFSSNKGFHLLPNLSIGFLGSWFKSYDPEQWKRNFSDNNSFAEFMLEKLSSDKYRFIDFKRKYHLEHIIKQGSSN
jgi:hypothetical protein